MRSHMESSDERNQRVMTIVTAARRQTPGEREQYVRQACQEDDELLREVSDALKWEDAWETYCSTPPRRLGNGRRSGLPPSRRARSVPTGCCKKSAMAAWRRCG